VNQRSLLFRSRCSLFYVRLRLSLINTPKGAPFLTNRTVHSFGLLFCIFASIVCQFPIFKLHDGINHHSPRSTSIALPVRLCLHRLLHAFLFISSSALPNPAGSTLSTFIPSHSFNSTSYLRIYFHSIYRVLTHYTRHLRAAPPCHSIVAYS
jgi:hypothetical protein